jgi:hypothetical protein
LTGDKLLIGENIMGGSDSSGAGHGAGRPVKRPKFYLVDGKPGKKASGHELLNREKLFQGHPKTLPPPLGRRGFREYPESPVFLADARLGPIDRDFEVYSGFWFISDRMKVVLEGVDPKAFAFLKCKVQLRDGTDGSPHWLCDVVRMLDALDEQESNAMLGTSDIGTKI